MELHSLHKAFHHSHLDEVKHQVLNLNQHLETYLSLVKHLEEENSLLGLEEELRQARLEVDAAWRDRVYTELEVRKLTEELQSLDQLRVKEASTCTNWNAGQ